MKAQIQTYVIDQGTQVAYNQADKRGHGKRTRGAGLGAFIGGVLGSFLGVGGAVLGAGIGAGIGASAGEEADQR